MVIVLNNVSLALAMPTGADGVKTLKINGFCVFEFYGNRPLEIFGTIAVPLCQKISRGWHNKKKPRKTARGFGRLKTMFSRTRDRRSTGHP